MEREYWFIVIAAILYSSITVGGQFFVNLGLSLYEISLYPYLLASLILLPIVLIKYRHLIKKELFLFFVIYGLISALLGLTQWGGIVLGVPIAIVALLLYSQPIWTTIFGKIILKEPITVRKIVAVIIAILGVIFILKPWNIESVGSLFGIISAMLGGIFLSLWIVLGRKSGIEKIHPIITTIGWIGFGTVWLLLLWPIVSFFIHEPNIVRLSISFQPLYLFYLAIFTVIAHILPYLFFYKGIQKIHASIAGIIMLLEPIAATMLAALIFVQPIGLNILSGGALILLSNYLIIHKK